MTHSGYGVSRSSPFVVISFLTGGPSSFVLVMLGLPGVVSPMLFVTLPLSSSELPIVRSRVGRFIEGIPASATVDVYVSGFHAASSREDSMGSG